MYMYYQRTTFCKPEYNRKFLVTDKKGGGVFF